MPGRNVCSAFPRVAGLAALLLTAGAMLGAGRAEAYPSCKLDPQGTTVCFGHYALCAKATCKALPDGKNVECTCPVLDGPSIADPNQTGNHACAPSDPKKIYSFFSLQGLKSNGLLTCPAGTQWAQCWNAPCTLEPGGTQAKCVCPLCPGPFASSGGDCNTANCTADILVGFGFPTKGAARCVGR